MGALQGRGAAGPRGTFQTAGGSLLAPVGSEQGVLTGPHQPVAVQAGVGPRAGGGLLRVRKVTHVSWVYGKAHLCAPQSTVWALTMDLHAVTPSCLRVPKCVAAPAVAA